MLTTFSSTQLLRQAFDRSPSAPAALHWRACSSGAPLKALGSKGTQGCQFCASPTDTITCANRRRFHAHQLEGTCTAGLSVWRPHRAHFQGQLPRAVRLRRRLAQVLRLVFAIARGVGCARLPLAPVVSEVQSPRRQCVQKALFGWRPVGVQRQQMPTARCCRHIFCEKRSIQLDQRMTQRARARRRAARKVRMRSSTRPRYLSPAAPGAQRR